MVRKEKVPATIPVGSAFVTISLALHKSYIDDGDIFETSAD